MELTDTSERERECVCVCVCVRVCVRVCVVKGGACVRVTSDGRRHGGGWAVHKCVCVVAKLVGWLDD
jgi:hypothetical protein